jgi:hypothetical protein
MLGHFIGKKQQVTSSKSSGITRIAEGTVFALLGLLIAFTFSGAYDRFEQRKYYIIDDANSIKRLYSRIDLLKPQYQESLRQLIRQYLEDKIVLYHSYSSINPAHKENQRLQISEKKLWHAGVTAVQGTNNTATTLLFIDAINNMFELTNKRLAIAKIHPPIPIFTLLIFLAMLSCFLIGYSLSEKKISHPIFVYSYILVISFTIYLIIELELPRIGVIRLDRFDYLLVETKNNL